MNANLLKAALAERGMNQAQLARKIGISTNSMSRKMNGKRDFTLSEVLAISHALQLEQPQLIFFADTSQKCNGKEA